MEKVIEITIFQAIVLGLVQGLGEFLPISSSAHLVIAPWAFGWDDPGLGFDVALHAGTLGAILLYFHRDWISLTKSLPGLLKPFSQKNYWEKLLIYLVIATIPGAVIGYALKDYAESVFRNPLLVGTSMILLGALLWWADSKGPKKKNIQELGLRDGLLIGFSQALAIIPGVSRSGSTMTAGLILGFDRLSAARFSFLMSAPIIFGATILNINEIAHVISTTSGIISLAVSFLSGMVAIHFLLKLVARFDFKVFCVYRFVFGIGVYLIYFF